MTVPKPPVKPILGISIHVAQEPGSDPVLHEKMEYSKMEAPLIDDDCRYDLKLLIKLQEYTHFGNNI